MTTDERLRAERDILAFVSAFGPRGHNANCGAWERLEAYIENLIAKEWSRLEVFEVMKKVYSENGEILPPAGNDALSNLLSGLSGECHPDGIVRFPSDPVDPEEFILYVRSLGWMKSSQDTG